MEIIKCKDCIHRPIFNGKEVVPPQNIYGRDDMTCSFLREDSYYNCMPSDHFFCFSGEKKKFAVLLKDYTMPTCCDNCDCFDISGDYPFCLLTHHSTGYNFDYLNKRMDDCPFVIVEEKEVDGQKVLIEVAGKENK